MTAAQAFQLGIYDFLKLIHPHCEEALLRQIPLQTFPALGSQEQDATGRTLEHLLQPVVHEKVHLSFAKTKWVAHLASISSLIALHNGQSGLLPILQNSFCLPK